MATAWARIARLVPISFSRCFFQPSLQLVRLWYQSSIRLACAGCSSVQQRPKINGRPYEMLHGGIPPLFAIPRWHVLGQPGGGAANLPIWTRRRDRLLAGAGPTDDGRAQVGNQIRFVPPCRETGPCGQPPPLVRTEEGGTRDCVGVRRLFLWSARPPLPSLRACRCSPQSGNDDPRKQRDRCRRWSNLSRGRL